MNGAKIKTSPEVLAHRLGDEIKNQFKDTRK